MCNQFNSFGSRLSPVCRSNILAIALVSTLLMSGCAVNGNSIQNISSADQLVTNSVAEKSKPEGISETDANVIKETVAATPLTTGSLPQQWKNTETGSTGTIVSIDRFKGKHGQRCRGFKTSVNSFTGVAYFNGEACQLGENKWVLSWFKAAG